MVNRSRTLGSRLNRWLFLVTAFTLYAAMLWMGAIEDLVDFLPGGSIFNTFYHLVFYFSLGGLLWFGLPRVSVMRITLIIAVVGCIDEMHQYVLPFRHARITDVLLDAFAGMLAALILQRLHNGRVPAD